MDDIEQIERDSYRYAKVRKRSVVATLFVNPAHERVCNRGMGKR